jgi:hypothetical protein
MNLTRVEVQPDFDRSEGCRPYEKNPGSARHIGIPGVYLIMAVPLRHRHWGRATRLGIEARPRLPPEEGHEVR